MEGNNLHFTERTRRWFMIYTLRY